MKYLDYAVTFSEFPDEISLCINISNCPFHCPGCHSPELWKDKGIELSQRKLEKLISDIPKEIDIKWFDYIKIGPYIQEKGGLDNPNTNQRFYAKGSTLHKMDANSEMLYDVTYKFWKHGED